MYLLDTNSVIYFFKGMGAVASRLLSKPPSEIGISAVSIYELEVGIAKSSDSAKRRAQLDALLSVVQTVPFAQPEARTAAKVRAQLEKKGEPIGPLDNLIAGCALEHGAILVTRNVKEFARIKGLRVESWF